MQFILWGQWFSTLQHRFWTSPLLPLTAFEQLHRFVLLLTLALIFPSGRSLTAEPSSCSYDLQSVQTLQFWS